MTVRTLENWKRAAGEEPRREGRPPLKPERWKASLWRVARTWKGQGRGSGWRTVHAALGGKVSKHEVQVLLRGLKARRRRLERRRIEASRVSARVECKDAIWSVDGTHLGRADGAAVEGMAVRDVATQKTLAVLAGASASGADVARLLEAVAAERGALPLAVATDNGGPNAAAELAGYLQAKRIVHLRSVPRTPQHNAWVERGHAELKEDGGLGKGVRLRDAAEAAERVARSMRRANGVRLRRSLGYRTADAVDAVLPSWYGRACRARFYKAACAAREKAVLGHGSPRARRLAEREATFRTMEDFRLVSRTRGGIPLPLSNPKCFPTHHRVPQSSDPLGNRWTFTGRSLDEESGLLYYRARYYDPVTGRFLQRDPKGYSPSAVLFEYVRSAVTSLRDPTGLDPVGLGQGPLPPKWPGGVPDNLPKDFELPTGPEDDPLMPGDEGFGEEPRLPIEPPKPPTPPTPPTPPKPPPIPPAAGGASFLGVLEGVGGFLAGMIALLPIQIYGTDYSPPQYPPNLA